MRATYVGNEEKRDWSELEFHVPSMQTINRRDMRVCSGVA